jgi:hypothetical protein
MTNTNRQVSEDQLLETAAGNSGQVLELKMKTVTGWTETLDRLSEHTGPRQTGRGWLHRRVDFDS